MSDNLTNEQQTMAWVKIGLVVKYGLDWRPDHPRISNEQVFAEHLYPHLPVQEEGEDEQAWLERCMPALQDILQEVGEQEVDAGRFPIAVTPAGGYGTRPKCDGQGGCDCCHDDPVTDEDVDALLARMPARREGESMEGWLKRSFRVHPE